MTNIHQNTFCNLSSILHLIISHRKRKLFILRFALCFVGNDFPLSAPFMHEIPSLLVAFFAMIATARRARSKNVSALLDKNIKLPILTDVWSGKNVFQFVLTFISFIVATPTTHLRNKVHTMIVYSVTWK